MPNNKKVNKSAGAVTMSERLSNYICPMLLGGALCFSIIYALYRPAAYMCTVGFLAAEYLFFCLFDKLKRRPLAGGLLYTLIFFGIEIAAGYCLVTGAYYNNNILNPVTWFYGDEGSYNSQPLYLAAVMLGGGFFMISILYYFTQIRYRSLGAMLCILFPFVIYAKRAEEIPEILVTLIVTMFIAVMVHNRRIDPSMPKEMRGVFRTDLSYIISIALFVTITGAVTMMIDKPKYTSELEKNANYFNYYNTGAGAGNYDELGEDSSQRYGMGRPSNDPLFYFETDGTAEEYFLRSTSFDYFDGDVWKRRNMDDDYSYVYSSVFPEYSYDDILEDMRVMIEEDSGIGSVKNVSGKIPVKQGLLFDDDFAPEYLPAPYGIITDYDRMADIEYKKYPQGVVIRKGAVYDNVPVLNDGFSFMDPGDSYYQYAAALGLSRDEYIGKLLENGSENALRLYNDYMNAESRYLDLQNTSERVQQLAKEIVDGAQSEMEKAQLLEGYFEENGYVYDIDYVPNDRSIDYFIFEGKTGVCSSYATAMTLMARSVGLPARYVEGFACFEPTENEEPSMKDSRSFVIRDSHAHAFVEVYIPGAGWLTFDPTVSDYKKPQTEDNGGKATMFLKLISRLMLVIIVGFVIVFVLLLDRLAELLLRLRLPFMQPGRRVLRLYQHLIWLTNYSTKRDYSAYTAAMLSEYFHSTRGCSPDKLIALFERVCFGGYVPTAGEWRGAYREYRRCYRYLRKIPKPKKLEKLLAATA